MELYFQFERPIPFQRCTCIFSNVRINQLQTRSHKTFDYDYRTQIQKPTNQITGFGGSANQIAGFGGSAQITSRFTERIAEKPDNECELDVQISEVNLHLFFSRSIRVR